MTTHDIPAQSPVPNASGAFQSGDCNGARLGAVPALPGFDPALLFRRASSAAAIVGIRQFAEQLLPILNRACRDGNLPLSDWIAHVAPVATTAHAALPGASPFARAQARLVLGMLALSAERHAQPLGHGPGEVYQAIPHLAQTLIQATIPGRRPALNHHDYWITNTGPSLLSFTGEPHELFFIHSVQTQTWLRTSANQSLRPILNGQIPIDSTHTVRLLNTAATALEQGHQQYHDFKTSPMDAAGFNEMRVWLPRTRLGDKVYGGPNAAYIAEMATTDNLLGTADAHYRNYLTGFLDDVEPHEHTLLTADMQNPSLVEVLGAALGFGDDEGLAQASAQHVAQVLAGNPALHATATAARVAYRAFCGTSGAHYGHIHTKLIRYAETLTPAQRAALPVDPAAGVGGNSHEHTKNLHDTRRTTPAWTTLVTALAMLDRPTNTTTSRAPGRSGSDAARPARPGRRPEGEAA